MGVCQWEEPGWPDKPPGEGKSAVRGQIVMYLRFAMIALVVALFPAGFIAGCMDEKERFDHWKALQAAAGEAQEKRTKERIANAKQAKQEADRAHQKKLSDLRARHAVAVARLRADASRSVLPPVPDAAGRSDFVRPETACFDRDKLDAGIRGSLQRFAERSAEIVQRGAVGAAGFDTCAAWALREWQAK